MRLAFFSLLTASLLSTTAAPVRARSNTVPLIHIRAGEPLQFANVVGGACSGRLPLITVNAIDERDFRSEVSSSPFKRVVVFVPGFGTSMRLAYSAAARIQSDLGSDDRIVLVDWGSAGRKTAYGHDAFTARRNAPMLVPALLLLKQVAGQRELDVFAHSLGTRIVALAIPKFSEGDGVVVTSVVLAAPDMAVKDYQLAIVREPGPFRHITLYVSQRDKALLLSDIIHLHRRLGQITHWSKAMAKTDVVDASAASRGPDGHGYAITEPDLIHDVGLTLASAPMPHPLWKRTSGNQFTGWVYSPPKDSQPAQPCPKNAKVAAR